MQSKYKSQKITLNFSLDVWIDKLFIFKTIDEYNLHAKAVLEETSITMH